MSLSLISKDEESKSALPGRLFYRLSERRHEPVGAQLTLEGLAATDMICIHTDKSLKHTFPADPGTCHEDHPTTTGSYCGLTDRAELLYSLGGGPLPIFPSPRLTIT